MTTTVVSIEMFHESTKFGYAKYFAYLNSSDCYSEENLKDKPWANSEAEKSFLFGYLLQIFLWSFDTVISNILCIVHKFISEKSLHPPYKIPVWNWVERKTSSHKNVLTATARDCVAFDEMVRLNSLTKWLSVHLRTKMLRVRIPLQQ